MELPVDGFSGVVRVDRGGRVELAQAWGMADRAHQVPNTVDTRFGIASGTKSMTALTVVSLVESGALTFDTTARSVLGADLPLVDDAVSVLDLLGHRSGIGDYVDEDTAPDITDYLMPVPVHQLVETEDYLAALDGHPQKFPPGARFCYCNSGYVVLALIAERVSGTPFHQLVHERVLEPAGMHDSGFFRSDELPARTALGYLPIGGVDRTNVFHLPVRGSGDGGLYSTAADMSSFWAATFGGGIVSPATVADMVRPRGGRPGEDRRHGLGFWVWDTTTEVMSSGWDAGVSFGSVHDPTSGLTCTVLSNTCDSVWPILDRIEELLS